MFIDKKLNSTFNKNDSYLHFKRLIQLMNSRQLSKCRLLDSAVIDDCREFSIATLEENLSRRSGRVYIANNLNHINHLKIGRTSRTITEREKSLNSSGVIGVVKILYWVECIDSVMVERLAHKALSVYHIEKEFFDVEYEIATKTILDCSNLVSSMYSELRNSLTE